MRYVFEFDTVSKQLVATCDGAPVPELAYVELFRHGAPAAGGKAPDFGLRVRQVRDDVSSGVSTEVNTCASAEGAMVEDPNARRDRLAAVMRAALKRVGETPPPGE